MVEEAKQIKRLCRKYDAIFIINDSLDVAVKVNADGLHLGQEDFLFEEARKKMPGRFIGLSVGNIDEAIKAQEKRADYISAGPVFKTVSKDDAGKPIGLSKLREIRKAVDIPLVAIGGIKKENAASVIKAGADAIAVISAVASAEDMVEATRDLCYLFEQAKLAREK